MTVKHEWQAGCEEVQFGDESKCGVKGVMLDGENSSYECSVSMLGLIMFGAWTEIALRKSNSTESAAPTDHFYTHKSTNMARTVSGILIP